MLRNLPLLRDLSRLQRGFAGGFVFQNEPTGEGVLMGLVLTRLWRCGTRSPLYGIDSSVY